MRRLENEDSRTWTQAMSQHLAVTGEARYLALVSSYHWGTLGKACKASIAVRNHRERRVDLQNILPLSASRDLVLRVRPQVDGSLVYADCELDGM